MADTRGVFGLSRAYQRIAKGTWEDPKESFIFGIPQGRDDGYNSGGSTPASVSITDKTNYISDTTGRVPGADLNSGARKGLQGCGSVTAAYMGGGFPASDAVNKMPYSTETYGSLPAMSAARGYLAAFSSELAGYWTGGAPGSNTTTDKVPFSTDTAASAPSGPLPQARAFVHATGNTQFGYIGAGFLSPNYYSYVTKFTYGIDTAANLPSAGNQTFASEDNNASGSTVAGYFSGGFGPGSAVQSNTDKVSFVTDTTGRVPAADLVTPRYKHGQTGNENNGYISGGQTPARIATTEKLTYSTETSVLVPGASLSGSRSDMGSASSRDMALPTHATTQNLKGKQSFGYALFGGGPAALDGASIIEKIDFSTDTTGGVAKWTKNIDKGVGGSTDVAAYFGGPGTSIEKVPYATLSAVAVPGASPPNNIQYGAPAQNADNMYFVGGAPSNTKIDKLNFATETGSAVAPASMSFPRSWAYTCSNPSTGYIVGAGPSSTPTRSDIERMVFATETTSVLPFATIPGPRGEMGGSGNRETGYFAQGGQPDTSMVGRIVYATDTVGYPPAMTTSQAMAQGGQVGGVSAGYSIKGYSGPLGYQTTTHKINYLVDTTFRVPQAFSGYQNRDPAQTSSQDYGLFSPLPVTQTLSSSDLSTAPNTGYFGGGLAPGGAILKVDKLEYSTEIMARVPGADLSTATHSLGGTGSTTAGYFVGGLTPSPVATVNKLVYSTDSTSPAPSLPAARVNVAGVSSPTAAYFSGGQPSPTALDSTQKISFSDDTAVAVPGATMPTGVFYTAVTGNSTHGYFGAGRNPGLSPRNITNMQKLTYSSETFANAPSGSLSAARYGHFAGGNSEAGYYVAGYSIGWFPSDGYVSIVDKLSYSTDTRSFSPGAGVNPRGFRAATGNSSACYTFGGISPAPDTTQAEKLTFTTETSTNVPGALASDPVGNNAAVSARANSISAVSNVL